MSYTITKQCIGCQRCIPACPTGAIQTDGSAFWIDRALCNQCEGVYGTPQCWSTCPTNEGCVPLSLGINTLDVALTSQSENSQDYWETWFARYVRIVANLQATATQSSYWQRWFSTYTQTVKNLQPS